MSAYDPKADMGGSGLLPCKLTPEPPFAGRQSLLAGVNRPRHRVRCLSLFICETARLDSNNCS
jgi:hypothetical protein